MVVYCGDEVSALVLDIGGSCVRAGYAGDDTPKVVLPSWVGCLQGETQDTPVVENGQDSTKPSTEADAMEVDEAKTIPKSTTKYLVGDGETSAWRPHMELKNPLQDGLVNDWDLYEQIWHACFNKQLRVDPRENPLFVTEASWNTPTLREKLIELAFETFEFPAFYVSKDAVLSAFASGRSTAVVLDCGGTTTSAVAVYDGYMLKQGQNYSNVAGDFISEQILYQVQKDSGQPLVPRYQVASKKPVELGQPADAVLRNRPDTHPSYHHRMQLQTLHEYKETVCQVSEFPYQEDALAARPQKPFEFPDGFNVQVGIERYRLPEILFQPQEFIADRSQSVRVNGKPWDWSASSGNQPQANGSIVGNLTTAGPTGATPNPLVGVPRMIYDCVNACDIDVRPHLLNNVVLTGGSTLFPGFTDRVNFDLSHLAAGQRVRMHAAGNTVERKFSTWLGGSILASLGTFHQLWISRQDYSEHGASIVNKKCQ
ncbi:NuA4 histone acetyltransferase subunit [Dispira simplex]|nr:NuA4 histone acetyltransferase subunit [Dispira simplex]